MIMKKAVLIFSFILIFLLLFQFNSFALDDAENYYGEIWDQTDERTKEYLEELGIDEVSLEDLFDLTPMRVIKFLIKKSFSTGSTVFNDVVLIIIILIICSIVSSFLQDSQKMESIVSFFTALLILSVVIIPISRILTDASSAIKTSAVFVDSYLPVMCAVIIASKNPSLAFTYNSYSLFLSSIISSFSDKIFMPGVSALMSLNILSSFSFENYRDRIIKSIRRIIIVVLSLFSTVYTGLLTTQSILASSSDNAVLKGIKFISGTFVPVVGSGVGDAISSVFSSFLVMRNTLGVFVIIAILLINLPVIIELLVWYFALQICSVISSMFNLKYITDIIDNLSSVISLLNIIVFFVTFVLVISTGVILIMGK